MSTTRYGEKRVWLAVALSIFTVAWGGNEFTPMLMLYREQGVFSDFLIDMMLIFYAIGVALGLLAAGPLSDRYGRKPIMLPAPLLAALGSLLIAIGEENAWTMALGRFLAGIAVGMVMTVGGSWIMELASPVFEPGVGPTEGARRASMSLTAGFALGPLVAGIIAQWLPMPGQSPYLVHIILSILLVPLLLVAPETRQSAHLKVKGSFWSDILVPSIRNRRFLFVVAPLAPWVFGAGFTAYAILPSLLHEELSAAPIAFTALMALLTLGTGFVIQQFGPKIMGSSRTRGPICAMVVTVLGMLGAAFIAARPDPRLALIVCFFLGLSYGLCMFVGLAELQSIAPPADLAGLTGVFYCLTYVGMIFPALLRKLNFFFSYPAMFGFGAIVALLALLLVSFTARKL